MHQVIFRGLRGACFSDCDILDTNYTNKKSVLDAEFLMQLQNHEIV